MGSSAPYEDGPMPSSTSWSKEDLKSPSASLVSLVAVADDTTLDTRLRVSLLSFSSHFPTLQTASSAYSKNWSQPVACTWG